MQPYSGPESSCRTAAPTKPRRSTTLARALPERGIKDGRTGTMKFLARRPAGQPRRLGGGPVTIEAAMTTAWLCTACATSAEQPPSYPPGPDAYCTGCRCPLDAQERIAAALAELVRRSGHRPMPEGPTCGVDEAARIPQTTANGIYVAGGVIGVIGAAWTERAACPNTTSHAGGAASGTRHGRRTIFWFGCVVLTLGSCMVPGMLAPDARAGSAEYNSGGRFALFMGLVTWVVGYKLLRLIYPRKKKEPEQGS